MDLLAIFFLWHPMHLSVKIKMDLEQFNANENIIFPNRGDRFIFLTGLCLTSHGILCKHGNEPRYFKYEF